MRCHLTKGGALGTPSALVEAVRAVREFNSPCQTADSQDLPLLAVTMGDPCGVGPEIIAKTLMLQNMHAVPGSWNYMWGPAWAWAGITCGTLDFWDFFWLDF